MAPGFKPAILPLLTSAALMILAGGADSTGHLGRRGRTGNQPVVGDPSRVPTFEGLPAYIALEAADLATVCHRLSAAINRAAFAGPVKRFSHASTCASDCPFSS